MPQAKLSTMKSLRKNFLSTGISLLCQWPYWISTPGKVKLSKFQPSLEGQYVSLRPLKAGDFEALYLAASDPEIWEQHFEPERYKREVFAKFFKKAIDSGTALLVTDKQTGEVIGTSRFGRIDLKKRELEIGYTFLRKRCWGLPYNSELKKLMIEHAGQFMNDIYFYVSKKNIRSQKAIEKLGAQMVEHPLGPQRKSYVYLLKLDHRNSL